MLAICLVAGMVLQRTARVSETAPAAINAVIMHVSLPALTLYYLHRFTFEPGALLAVAMPWGLFALGALVFWTVGRALQLSRASIGALTLVGGFGNTSFVGLPMIESLYGKSGLPLGLLIDQLGSYLALSTLGVLAATLYAKQGRTSWREIARKVMTFPPFVALLLAALLLPLQFPSALNDALARIGDTLAPLALLSVGLQLRPSALREHAKALSLGLGYKLLICPAVAVMLLWLLQADPGMASRVTVIESAMPPMIGAGIVASQARLNPGLVSLMIGIGIPMAFCTVPAWNWLFGQMLT